MKSSEHTASHEDVRSLKEAGIIDAETAVQASTLLRQIATSQHWLDFTRRGLLGLGLFHLLAGVVFFFAGNWSLLSKWERLSPILALIVLSGVVAWLRNGTLTGQLCLTVGSVLVGVFMAVFGQVYQTGADAWTLFANWSALSLVWVFSSRFFPLIGLWLIILQTAIALYAQQVLELEAYEWHLACLGVCLVALGAAHGRSFGAPRWFRRGVMVNAAVLSLLPMIESTIAVVAGVAVCIVSMELWRKRWIDDFFHVTVSVGIGLFCASVLFARHVLSPSAGAFETFFVLGGMVAISVAGAVSWLRSEWAKHNE